MKLKIVNKSTNALPEYKTPDSSGMDLRAYLPEGSITLAPMERKIIPNEVREVLVIPAKNNFDFSRENQNLFEIFTLYLYRDK